jgi:hypothetical protein
VNDFVTIPREVLERLQWVGGVCPICGAWDKYKGSGEHTPDCAIRAALAQKDEPYVNARLFSEIHMDRNGKTREMVPLERVEKWFNAMVEAQRERDDARDALSEGSSRIERMADLLRRVREWEDSPSGLDGAPWPFSWFREADELLAKAPK